MQEPRILALIASSSLLLANACNAQQSGPSTPAAAQRAAWSAPPLLHQVSVRDGRSGERLSFEALLDRLAAAQVVFLGETHIDETTHRAELAIYEGLLRRRAGRVVLALEMFERDVQPSLDAYVSGSIDEATFLSAVRPWSNYATAYRPMIERARADRRPVVASNFPAPLRRRLMREGDSVLDRARAEAPSEVPAELQANTPEYWRRVDNAVRSHRGMMGGDPDDEQRLTATQSLWDNSMGEACALALDRHPGHSVLHVNGGFHSQYWDGTVRQLRLRRPDVDVLTVALVPSIQPAIEEVRGAPEADFVVFTEQRARDLNEGTYAVHVLRELEYRLHLPQGSADAGPVPLLIWLGDEGQTSEDGLRLWRSRLGDDVVIAALEPPYRALAEDLAEGGRWFWPDTFPEDLEALREGVERTWAFLLRHYPIDPDRVVLAGEGTGATVVSGVTLLTWRMQADGVAFAPRRYARLKDIPLPLPELFGDDEPPARTLRALVGEPDQAWWTSELAEYVEVGLPSEAVRATDDPWLVEREREDELRRRLGLQPRPAPEPDAQRAHVVVDGPRARFWARLLGLSFDADGTSLFAVLDAPPAQGDSQEFQIAVQAADFAAPGRLPRCPGPFGGSTVVVVPAEASEGESGAWRALEQADPLARSGPFYRLRIATSEPGRTLPEVLERLRSEGRENVLVVPAVFCADAADLRALRRSVRDLEDAMTIHWSPGLGAPADD